MTCFSVAHIYEINIHRPCLLQILCISPYANLLERIQAEFSHFHVMHSIKKKALCLLDYLVEQLTLKSPNIICFTVLIWKVKPKHKEEETSFSYL